MNASLTITYNDENFNFIELLEKYNSISRNIPTLAIEMCKVANDVSPKIMPEIFQPRGEPCYNLRYT